MKAWWQRWSHEIPLAIGDALWEVLVVQFAAFLDRLTVRKVIEFIAIAVLVMAFAQTLPIDLAILFAGDMLMYLEFIVAVRLATGKMHLQQVVQFALRVSRATIRMARDAIHRPWLRLNRWRAQRSAARPAIPRRGQDREDDPGAAWGAAAIA